MVAFDFHMVKGVRRQHCKVVLVRQPTSGGDFEVMKQEVVIGQAFGKPLDGAGLAVVLRDPDSMDNRHDWKHLIEWP